MPEAIKFASWEPDKSDRENPASEAKGVVSIAGQYAPFKDIQDYNASSAATAAACLGAATFYENDQTPHIYMGSTTKLLVGAFPLLSQVRAAALISWVGASLDELLGYLADR